MPLHLVIDVIGQAANAIQKHKQRTRAPEGGGRNCVTLS